MRWFFYNMLAVCLCCLVGVTFCGCEDDDDDDTTVVTNETGEAEDTGPVVQTLFTTTRTINNGDTYDTDTVEAPDDGDISTSISWGTGDSLLAGLFKNGAAFKMSGGGSPLSMSGETDDGDDWMTRVQNASGANIDVTITITYTSD